MNTKKKAFTIAEIVVAMLVLGAIAMILMPVLYHDTEDKVINTALSRTYTTFQQTARSTGFLISTGKIAPSSNAAYTFFQALTATAKTTNLMNLDNNNDNIATQDENPQNNATRRTLATYLADYTPDTVTGITPDASNTVVLKNGVFVMLDTFNNDNYIVVDVNGKKGPNIAGKDIFYFSVEKTINSYSISPAKKGSCDLAQNDKKHRIGCTRQKLNVGR